MTRAFSWSLLLLAASRLLGVLRDSLVATQFGLSGHADAALVALSYPDFIIALLWGAAVPAVMVPRMAGHPAQIIADEHARWSRFALLAFGLVGALSLALRLPIAHALAPGLHGTALELAASTLGWSALLALPAGALTMVSAAALQAQRRPQWQYAGHLVFNLGAIIGLLLAARRGHFGWLAAGIVAAALLRQLLLRRVAQRSLVRPTAAPAWPDADGLRAAALALLASGLTVLYTLAARALASAAGPGELGLFHYAQRVSELPLNTLFAVAASLALAWLAAAESAGRGDQARQRGRQWMQSMLWVAALLALPGMLAAPLLVRLLFGWGRMDAGSQQQLALAMRWFLALLPLQAAQLVLAARLNSHRRLLEQVLAYGAGLLALLALGTLLPPQPGRAIAAYAAAYAVAVVGLWLGLARASGDAETRNALLLLLLSAALAAAAAVLPPLPMLGGAVIAAALVAIGGVLMLRLDALGRIAAARLGWR